MRRDVEEMIVVYSEIVREIIKPENFYQKLCYFG